MLVYPVINVDLDMPSWYDSKPPRASWPYFYISIDIFVSMPKSPAIDSTLKVCRAVIDPETGEVRKECRIVDAEAGTCGCSDSIKQEGSSS